VLEAVVNAVLTDVFSRFIAFDVFSVDSDCDVVSDDDVVDDEPVQTLI
jgi:hypothetical protein